MPRRPRNPPDATLRNVRASQRQHQETRDELAKLRKRLARVEANHRAIEDRLAALIRGEIPGHPLTGLRIP